MKRGIASNTKTVDDTKISIILLIISLVIS
jgi:hypothetical protein